MNVFWLLNVDGMQIRKRSFVEVMIATNFLMIPIGIIDWLTGANYMYLRFKPPVDNPLLIGEWPWYILGIEVLGAIYCGLLYMVMKILGKVQQNKSELAI